MAAGGTAVIKIVLLPRLSKTFTSESSVTGSLGETNLISNVATLAAQTMP
jgi:hypothetical protein